MVSGLRVAFFGTPAFAVPTLRRLLDSRHQVVAVVSQPDRPKGRGQRLAPTATKETALARSVQVLQPDRIRDEVFLAQIRELAPDLGVVAAYGKILPASLLAIPRFGMVNVHASLLPAYRGAAPVHRAVIAGETETGVTIMRVVQELDAGPTFASARRSIAPDETSVDVEHGLAEIGASLLLDVIDLIWEGRATETPQDDSRATYAPKLTRADGVIDWKLPAVRIHDLVRGLHPWPLASVSVEGVRYLLHQVDVGNEAGTPPGTIIHASGDRFDVAAGDGRTVHIRRIQPEGRRVMSAREFLAGHRLTVGAALVSP